MRLAYLILPLTAACGLSAIPMMREATLEPQASSLVIADDQNAFVNEPIALQVLVAPTPQNESLKVVGLATGSRLSAGVAVGGPGWQLPAHDRSGVSIYPPADFVGTMHVMIALLSQDQKLLGLRAVRLQWTTKNAESSQAGSPISSGNSIAVAVPPKEQGEDDALQNAVSSPLDNYINSVSVNALAVKPGEHGDDIAAI